MKEAVPQKHVEEDSGNIDGTDLTVSPIGEYVHPYTEAEKEVWLKNHEAMMAEWRKTHS